MLKQLLIAGLAASAMAMGAEASAESAGPASSEVSTFTNLPEGVRFPEGITADPATGQLYVGTFDFGPNPNKLVRIGRDGRTIAQKDFGGTPLLGLGFANGKVYILNFGASKLQRIAASFDASTAVEDVATIPGIGAPAPRSAANPDGSSDLITFGSNSFPAPKGFPPFGANGLALNADETALFIANTGDNRVLKMTLATHAVSVFAESV